MFLFRATACMLNTAGPSRSFWENPRARAVRAEAEANWIYFPSKRKRCKNVFSFVFYFIHDYFHYNYGHVLLLVTFAI